MNEAHGRSPKFRWELWTFSPHFFVLCLTFPRFKSPPSLVSHFLIVFNKIELLWKLLWPYNRSKLNFMVTHAGRILSDVRGTRRPCSYPNDCRFCSTRVIEWCAIFRKTCNIAAACIESFRADSWFVFTAFFTRYHLEICTVKLLAASPWQTIAAKFHYPTNILILDVWRGNSRYGDFLCCRMRKDGKFILKISQHVVLGKANNWTHFHQLQQVVKVSE